MVVVFLFGSFSPSQSWAGVGWERAFLLLSTWSYPLCWLTLGLEKIHWKHKRSTKPEAMTRQSCPPFSSSLHSTLNTIIHPKDFTNAHFINSDWTYVAVSISYPKNTTTTWFDRFWNMRSLKKTWISSPLPRLYQQFENSNKIDLFKYIQGKHDNASLNSDFW